MWFYGLNETEPSVSLLAHACPSMLRSRPVHSQTLIKLAPVLYLATKRSSSSCISGGTRDTTRTLNNQASSDEV